MIAVAMTQYKGGTGKSTTAVHLAAAAACRGLKTVLIDTDVQGSASQWARRRTVESPHVVTVDAQDLSNCVSRFRGEFDFCIVDTAGHDWKALSCAAVAVDLTLIVSRPSQFDAETALQVRSALRDFKLRYAFLISQAAPRISRKSEIWADAYAAQGEVAGARLTYLTAYQDAVTLGLGVNEYEPNGRAAAEISALFDWIMLHFKEQR
jgi:chromosome partitioning protein